MPIDAKYKADTNALPGVETASEIIERIKTKAATEAGADADLLAILAEHILVAAPSVTAVENAVSAIEKLAASRANTQTT